ncbi:MAG: Flavohemoprotein [Gammaproteobacteria bacterium]|nr:Flavohemoprotein [Gammaproteobacteria bacterium]
MDWRPIHRWLGLVAGTIALILGITGAVLAVDSVRDAWQSVPAAADLPVAALAQRVSATISGAEEIRRLPSGDIVVYAFDAGRAMASRVDPADGRVLGPYRPSGLSHWFKKLHRSFLLGDAGRLGAAAVALGMLLLSVSGLMLMLRRMGGWRRLADRMRGSLVQRLHAATGRAVLVVLLLSSATALYMSAATFDLVVLDAGSEPDVVSVQIAQAELPAGRLPLLQGLRVGDLRRLGFPSAADPEDTWKVTTAQGQGWVDRYSGQTLAWQDATAAQRIHDWAMLLHTGEGAWVWALVLGPAGASIPLFWVTGLILWRQGRLPRPRLADNSPSAQADVLIFVASETGSTWGFAQTLHDALVRSGHRVHTNSLEHFQVGTAARRVFLLAATYGEGQPPAHAARALERIARTPVTAAQVAVLGFGDRQYPAFCAFAEALDAALGAQGWSTLLPLTRIHQQSAQEFARWGQDLARALGEPLELAYRPRLPPTTELQLLSRQDYPGGADQPAVILRFGLPAQRWRDRLAGQGLARFVAGDLLGVLAPGSGAPRYYSLASGRRDGFVEICVRRLPGGVCSGFLHGLQPGDSIQAFVRPNPGFALDGERRPVVLIGAGTGVAPLVGFIRANARRTPMHLYFGARDPARDFYFGAELERWLGEKRLASLRTVFSRVANGGGYVQDALHRDAGRVRALLARGAAVRVCGSRPMAQGVARVLDDILGTLRLSVAQLKAKGRYAEDVF